MSVGDSVSQTINAPAFKFILVVILILALTIPLLFAFLLVAERQKYARQARAAVGQMWGGAQTVRGPFIVAPTTRIREVRTKEGIERRTVREYAVFLPEDLQVQTDVKSEARARGIFTVPVYRSVIDVKGRFIKPQIRSFSQTGTEINWAEAVLVVTLDDVRGIKKTAQLTIDGSERKAFRAGISIDDSSRTPGIHVPLEPTQAQEGFAFSFTLELNGSGAIRFIPAGGETQIQIRADWPHPSFAGAFLPDERSISDSGFTATWTIPRLARGQGQTIKMARFSHLMRTKAFGVEFFQPIRFYSLAERALKYAIGFIAIVFLAVFIMEIQSKRRVHWIQYLFVGLALVIFYLVLIGTSEHIGFDFGYLAAAAATSILVGSYVGVVMSSPPRGLALTGTIGLIYGLLYLLLRIEDYAMLIGSLAAFSLLAIVMFATRNVDWSRGPGQTEQP